MEEVSRASFLETHEPEAQVMGGILRDAIRSHNRDGGSFSWLRVNLTMTPACEVGRMFIGGCDHPLDLARRQDNYVGLWQVVRAVLLNRWPEVQM